MYCVGLYRGHFSCHTHTYVYVDNESVFLLCENSVIVVVACFGCVYNKALTKS